MRKHLVHSVREEFAKVVDELETGCSLSKDHLCLEWPSERGLSFPVFRETGSSRNVHEQPDSGDLTSDGSMQDGRTAFPTIHGGSPATVTKEQSATDVSSPRSSTHSLPVLTGLQTEGSCKPQEGAQSDSGAPVETSLQPLSGQLQPCSATSLTLLSGAVGTNAAGEFTNTGDAAGMEPGLETFNRSGMETAAPESYSQLLDSIGPVQSNLPRDRESLLELRTQMAMELIWIKQAIASRQKVSTMIKKVFTALLIIWPELHGPT